MSPDNATVPDELTLFGLHLSALRKQRGWSQEQLALESGLARSYVGGIERGKRNLSLKNICLLARTLKVPAPELLNFQPPPHIAPIPTPQPIKRSRKN